jgi:hypothetical protein
VIGWILQNAQSKSGTTCIWGFIKKNTHKLYKKYIPENMATFSKTVARHGRCSSSKFRHVPQRKFRPINTANSVNSLNLDIIFLKKNCSKELANQQYHFANPQMQSIVTGPPNKKPIVLKVLWTQRDWSAKDLQDRLHQGQTASRWDIRRRGSLKRETLYWSMDGNVLMSMDWGKIWHRQLVETLRKAKVRGT